MSKTAYAKWKQKQKRKKRTPEEQAKVDAHAALMREAKARKQKMGKVEGYDLLGFYKRLESLKVKLKQGGVGVLGEVMRPNQQRFRDDVMEFRRNRKALRRFEVKPRQFASMSTTVDACIYADCDCNAGVDALVTAHQRPSLINLSLLFRYFAGRLKQGRETRISDYLYETKNGSRVTLQMATDDLGRSGSITHAHVSEADYIQDFREAWASMQPALSPAFWSMVVMETTLRRGVSSEFREILEAASRGAFEDWSVGFTSWMDVPELSMDVPDDVMASMLSGELDDYEKDLLRGRCDGEKLKTPCTYEQVYWYRQTRINGMFGSYDHMQEAYPTTLLEALKLGFGAAYFHADAIRFYENNTREPMARYMVGETVRPFEPGDSPAHSHLAVWEPPAFEGRYVIGADSADAEKRVAIDGSECYAVVMNQDTGEMCAEWHGYLGAYEFGHVLKKMATMFNNALIVPEVNYSGGSVIDALTKVEPGYHRIYRREPFNKQEDLPGNTLGFDSKGQSRSVLTGRLQRAIDHRLITIPSRYLVDQLRAFAKRNGVAVKRSTANVTPDDGVIALGLTFFGHRNMVDGVWTRKQARDNMIYRPDAPQVKVPQRGYRIEEDSGPRMIWDPIWNCYRKVSR